MRDWERVPLVALSTACAAANAAAQDAGAAAAA